MTVAPTALALGVLERRFNLIAHGTTVTTEVVAGLTGLAALVTAGLFLLSLFLYPHDRRRLPGRTKPFRPS